MTAGRCRACGKPTTPPPRGGRTPTWCDEACRRSFRRELARIDADIAWRERLLEEGAQHPSAEYRRKSARLNRAELAKLQAARRRLLDEGSTS